MARALTVDDLWPLVRKLSSEEQLELARRALRAAALADAEAYRARPPSATEFDADDDGLDWEAEGWEEGAGAREAASSRRHRSRPDPKPAAFGSGGSRPHA